MKLTSAQYGLLKAFLLVVLYAVAHAALGFFTDAANLSPFIGQAGAALIAMIAGSIEEHVGGPGDGMFGAVKIV